MRLIWSFRSLPELGHLEPAQRDRLIKASITWRVWLYLILGSAVAGLPVGVGGGVLVYRWVSPAAGVVAGLLIWLAIGLGLFQFRMQRIRADLRRYLKEAFRGQRLPVCLGCGYNLRRSTADKCPECGAPTIVPKSDRA